MKEIDRLFEIFLKNSNMTQRCSSLKPNTDFLVKDVRYALLKKRIKLFENCNDEMNN